MRIDSHQHFWKYSDAAYPWIAKGSPLQRDWLPADLAAVQKPLGLDGSIAVQARQTLEESRWLLSLADQHASIKGVVGWVDLCSGSVTNQLEEFSKHPKFVGVRHVVQDEPDAKFMLRPDFLRGIAGLHRFKLTYDILIYPRQLPAAIELAKRFPEQPFVLDHIAKPPIKEAVLSPWREQIEELAGCKNVSCKVSGMVTEANLKNWKAADFKPYLDVIFAAFGDERLMFGSDWPVCLLAGSYAEVHGLFAQYAASRSGAAQAGLWGGNAARFYGIQN